MKVEIGDAVKLADGLQGKVTAIHESGAVDVLLEDGRSTYALPGNFEESDGKSSVTTHGLAGAPKTQQLGAHTTVTRGK